MASTQGIEHVVVKLGLLKQGDDAVFRRIPFENLELTGANDTAGIDKLKKYAVLMFEGSSDLDKVNLDDYVVVLMYKDSDDDKVLIFTDYDIISALKEYSMVGKVKILAEVNSKKASVGSDSSRATVSTQTFVFNAEKETQASATPSQEIPPVTSFTFSSAGAPAELTGSIADILRFAAASSASSKNVSDALHKAAAAVDEQATKVGTEAESKAQQKDVNGVDKSVQHNQDDSSCPSVSTQTFIFNAEEGDKASATPSHEVPPATAFAFSSAEPSADLAGSIADILRFAAGAAVSSATSKTVTDALQKAATAVEEQAKKASATAQSKVQQAQSAVDSGVHCAVRNTERATRQAARSARQAARSVRHSVTPSAPKEDDVSQELSGGVHPAKGGDASRNSEFVAVQSHSKPETEPTPATATERLFIHGRHTCDGCLTTPIIGKRFHAVNKTDYDLCEKCFNNHNGSDMAFEEATLDRDVPFQDRWHARRDRMLGGRRCSNSGHGARGPCFFRANGTPVPPPAPHHPPHHPPCGRHAMPHAPCGRHAMPHHPPCGAHPMYSSDISGAVDVAMNEAIRRSLADLGTSQNAENSESAGKKESDVEVETVNESDSEEHEHVTSSDVSAESMKPDATEEPVQDHCNAEPEIVVPGELGTNENAEPDIYVRAVVSNSSDVDVHVDVEDSSATVAASEPLDTKPETFSFASDAEGATATILGSTLDKMAEAIDNLNWELERAADSSCGTEDDEGAKIVDGDEVDDEDDDDSTSSHNSWQVVSEDEQISRAAQALGSALFNSELERSSENLSTLSNSGTSAGTDLSTLATVPSTVRSLNTAPSQLLRWSAQLQQLQELGFTNDAESVDILESLTAANIGVDSDDEVTVEQVINVMMKDT